MAEKMLTPRGTYRIIPRRWLPIKNFMLKKYGITLHLWYKIWYHPNMQDTTLHNKMYAKISRQLR